MDWLVEGTTALISGMSAVFIILILISMMISALGNIGKLEKKIHNEVAVHAVSPKEVKVTQENQAEEERRIAAAITAALSMELGLSSEQFVVRKFRRL